MRLSKPRILVIDDDETILELIRDALSTDYDILTAQDALEAVDLLLNEHFDLLIVDLGMPIVDGIELIQKLRASSPFRQIPILVISAFPELRTRVGTAEVQAILPKPFAIDDLLRHLEEALDSNRDA